MTIYSWCSHKKWWFSIVMLIYQRVKPPSFPHLPMFLLSQCPVFRSAWRTSRRTVRLGVFGFIWLMKWPRNFMWNCETKKTMETSTMLYAYVSKLDTPIVSNQTNICGRVSTFEPEPYGLYGDLTTKYRDIFCDSSWAQKGTEYPLVNVQKTMENHHAINGKINYKLPFSIAILT